MADLSNKLRKQLQQAVSRHGRQKTGLFICEGFRCCREALTNCSQAIEAVIVSGAFQKSADHYGIRKLCDLNGLQVTDLPDEEFNKIAATENPQGVACLCQRERLTSDNCIHRQPFVLVLDGVSEPGNLGTILRTAWAVGLREVWCTKGTTDPFGPKAIRSGMGAQFALVVNCFDGLASVKNSLNNFEINRVWRSAPDSGVSCYSDEFKLDNSALVIGSEAHGAAPLKEAQDVFIPMPGAAESLNVGQAATILLFEGVRRGLLKGER